VQFHQLLKRGIRAAIIDKDYLKMVIGMIERIDNLMVENTDILFFIASGAKLNESFITGSSIQIMTCGYCFFV
jgi:hypothetical protein